jgi:hypothetical protein
MNGQTNEPMAWRCTSCGSLLGRRRADGSIEMRHKEHAVRVAGPAQVVVPCRRCSRENAIELVA